MSRLVDDVPKTGDVGILCGKLRFSEGSRGTLFCGLAVKRQRTGDVKVAIVSGFTTNRCYFCV
jgi:hypothetical protein